MFLVSGPGGWLGVAGASRSGTRRVGPGALRSLFWARLCALVCGQSKLVCSFYKVWDEWDPASAGSSRGEPMPVAAGGGGHVSPHAQDGRCGSPGSRRSLTAQTREEQPRSSLPGFQLQHLPSSTAPAAEQAGAALQLEEGGDATRPLLFVQLNQLVSTPTGPEWREVAR